MKTIITFLCCLSVCIGMSSVSVTKTWFTMRDGIELQAYVYMKNGHTEQSELSPLIVFINSWAFGVTEYARACRYFARRGYIVVEYETRGFHNSGGYIDGGGPLDIADGSNVLDRIFENADKWKINKNKVAFSGISYGAGISLLVTAHDDRITTCLPLSGWSVVSRNIVTNGHSVNKYWWNRLHNGAQKHGNCELKCMQSSQWIKNQNQTFLKYVDSVSSPMTFINLYNKRDVPIFFVQSYADPVLPMNEQYLFFKKLTVPKMMIMNQGTHAMPSLIGMHVLSLSYIWRHFHKWVDHWLKDIPNGIYQDGQISTEIANLHHSPFMPRKIYSKGSYPMSANPMDFFTNPRSNKSIGKMTFHPSNHGTDTIYYRVSSSLDIGKQPVSMFLESLGQFHHQSFDIDPIYTALFTSDLLPQNVRMCGIPSLSIAIRPPKGPWQVAFYLYSTNKDSTEHSLLSYTGYTYRTTYSKPPIDEQGFWHLPTQFFPMICVDINAFSSISLGIELHTNTYMMVHSSVKWSIDILHGGHTKLSIPSL